ncbi:MAG TPA: tyrosine-type recombinase/integrase [Bryobacteraceae bacterium]|jgi:integrase|nr:tyrosine-type recombinase/integrase [Bryobacteraceae bacterium]
MAISDQKVGIRGFRFHDLRHTFITTHAEIGTPLPVVIAQAGYLSRKMTEIYTHISQRSIQDAAERFERFERKKAELVEEAKKQCRRNGSTKPTR